MTVSRRKLIEVSLPLEAINRESAREKSIRHGHPSTLHLWWARRPLAAARAVLFAQLVDDPSAHPERYPTEEDQERRRAELHALIEKLVLWDNSKNSDVLAEAHKEIVESTDGHPPTILDPFAGGGTIPLEAQRLGLNTIASDLNPVAVLINKALIELPPKFRNQPPVNPGLAASQIRTWKGAQGIAADLLAYGQWMRDEAEKRIGHLYPKARLADGSAVPVIAWIWARTVACPNPRCRVQTPLVRSWWLGKKKGREAYAVPTVADGQVTFAIGRDTRSAPNPDSDGTVARTGATCVACGSAASFSYIRGEGRAGRLGAQLMATVAEGDRQRIYLAPTPEHEAAVDAAEPAGVPEGELFDWPGRINVVRYGITSFSQLFTKRQLAALCTFSDLITEARDRVLADALSMGIGHGQRVSDGGTGALAYAEAIATYLGFIVSKTTARNNTMCTWEIGMDRLRGSFQRQAMPMTWDFAETNPLEAFGGGFSTVVQSEAEVLEALIPPANTTQCAVQRSATDSPSAGLLICTDPPYYDNIGYSDLSDFFYIWLRRSLRPVWPDLLSTMLVPKAEELVANPYRHNGNDGARHFFEDGFTKVFARARAHAPSAFPITVFYAFKQAEPTTQGQASAGWETLLEGMVRSGWMITGTWPMRSELGNRMLAKDTNALASSVVLALRPRDEQAPVVDRRGFIAAMRAELPARLRELQHGAIAPVDLPQAAIGPGMAVFTRYTRVIDSDGSTMTVRSALARINEVLDEVLTEQEGDFDATTRLAISWYRQHGYNVGPFGAADSMARARNTSVANMERAGILTGRAGKVSLLPPNRLSADYDPVSDQDISAWEVLHHLVRILDSEGLAAAGALLAQAGNRVDHALIKELAYLLYSVANDKKWVSDAIAFNNIATSWSDLLDAARAGDEPLSPDPTFDFTTDDEDV